MLAKWKLKLTPRNSWFLDRWANMVVVVVLLAYEGRIRRMKPGDLTDKEAV